MTAAWKVRDASICRRRREESNEDRAAGEGVAALGDDKNEVDVVDDLGGGGEVRGCMALDGEVGCYCSYFSIFVDSVGHFQAGVGG